MKLKHALWLSLGLVVLAGVGYLIAVDSQLRGGALDDAMQTVLDKNDVDAVTVGKAILASHRETRQIASIWSFLYWGFAWGAAALSALAGLVLKVESFFPDEKRKRDLAALLTVVSAILVTISTGGDFQRKWQANRTASAEIERTGYAFLEKNGENPRGFLLEVGNSLEKRHLAILGSSDSRKAEGRTSPTSAVKQ